MELHVIEAHGCSLSLSDRNEYELFCIYCANYMFVIAHMVCFGDEREGEVGKAQEGELGGAGVRGEAGPTGNSGNYYYYCCYCVNSLGGPAGIPGNYYYYYYYGFFMFVYDYVLVFSGVF